MWKYIFLPPYSPIGNIIEEAFSCLKSAIKSLLTVPLLQLKLKIANMQFGVKTNARRVLLEEALNNSVNTIIQPKAQTYWDQMLYLIRLKYFKTDSPILNL